MKYLDLNEWPRKEHFHFFRQLDYPYFNVCANMDISRLLPYIKERNHSFYTTFIYLTSRVANNVPEFRYRIQGENVVEYDVVHPSFTVMSGTGPFKYCTVAYESEIHEFYRLAELGIKKTENSNLLGDSNDRDDLLYMTCIPWVSFTNIMHPIHLHPADSIPRIAWGKYFTDHGTVKIPLSIQAHHAVMDGYHVGRYFEELQELVDHPERYFEPNFK